MLSARPSFSDLVSQRRRDNPSSTCQATNAVLDAIGSCVPLVTIPPRLLLVGFDHARKVKQAKILRVCSRLQTLHAWAVEVATLGKQLPKDEWVAKYQDLVLRFADFAKQYEKKRCVLLRIARRAKHADDAAALDGYDREIDGLYFELS